jgi:glycosyltransferase involved in cell wall biosynthesis
MTKKNNRKTILFAPSHFTLSDKLGSEFNEAWELITTVYKKNDFDLEIITGKKDYPEDKFKLNAREIWRTSNIRNSNEFTLKDSVYFTVQNTFATIRYLYFSRKKIDIVHHIRPFNLYVSFNLAAIFRTKKSRFVIGPFCQNYHGKPEQWYLKPIVFLNKITLKSADAILVNDDITKTEVEEFIGKKTVHIMPVGKQLEEFEYTPKTYYKNSYTFLTSSQLIPRKHIDFLIRGFAIACKNTNKTLHLHIIGDGSEKNMLTELVEELGINENVSILGSVPFESTKTYYKNADYFLFTPYQEAFGHVLVEASLYGLPIISTMTRGSLSVVTPTGIPITPQNNLQKFSQNILSYIHSPAKSTQVSSLSRSLAIKRFDWNSTLYSQLSDIYKNILK